MQRGIMEIDSIQKHVISGTYRFSDHAVKRMIQRSIDRHEVEEAILSGEIIEEYPDDKYSPSCLVYGMSLNGRELHIHVSLPPLVVIVTIYEPATDKWIEGKIRR